MSPVANVPGTGTSLLRKSVLIFGSGGTLGSAVAHAFAAAQWRVIGCSSGWSGAPPQGVAESTGAVTRSAASPSPRSATGAAIREGAAANQDVPGKRTPASPECGVPTAAGEARGTREQAEEGAAVEGRAAAEWPKFEKWHHSARGWRATAAPPHAVVDVAAQSFDRAFSLQKQGEDLLEQLQPLLAAGPPLHAAICCSGAFDMTPPGSAFFLDEAQRLIKANCWPALLCAHTAVVLQQEQRIPLLLVLTGAAAVAQTRSTPSMIAYGCAKSYVHHLVRSLAAASMASAATHRKAPAAVSAAATSTVKHQGKVGSSNTHARSSSSRDKGSSRESTLHRENHISKPEGVLPSLRVVGLLPTILDTPANRANMKEVSDSVRSSTWTDVRDVAQQLLRWAENPEAVANGQFCVVSTHKGKTEFALL